MGVIVRIACLCLAVSVFTAGSVRADDGEKEEAQQHFRAGTRLYKVEDYSGAVAEFEASVRLYPTKNGYYNLANCYKALHRYHEAMAAVDELEARFANTLDRTMARKAGELKELILSLVGELVLVVNPPDAEIVLDGEPLKKEMRKGPLRLGPGEHRLEFHAPGYKAVSQTVIVHTKKRRELEVTLPKLNGTLAVTTDVDGATVLVDGNRIGETPLDPFTVSPGTHRLDVNLDGYSSQTRTLQIAPDAWTTLEIRLASGEDAEDDAASEGAAKARKFPFKPVKYAAVGLTAASAILTGVFYGLAAASASDFSRYDQQAVDAQTLDERNAAIAARSDAEEKTDRFAAVGLASAVCTGVFGAATAVLWVVDKKRERKESAISLEGGRLTVRF